MRRLRFCFPTTFYPPYGFGGDGVVVRRLARALVSRGHEVVVVHDVDAFKFLHRGADPGVATEPDGLTVVPLRSRMGALSCLLTHQTGRPVVHGARLRRILEHGRFDVVNFHNVSLVGGPGILSYGGDVLRLYTAHEHWLVCPMHVLWRHGKELCTGKQCLRCSATYRRPPQLYRLNGTMERQLERVDTFIAMSEFSRDKHHEFGFPHPMEVVPCFLPDPDAEGRPQPRPHERPYFLFVGRLEKIKGVDDVIPLFEGYPDADLLVAGDGKQRDALHALGANLDNVRFLGRVPLDQLRAYYENALALIVPSIGYETFGTILIEALSFGTPVIARRLGPFPEIVERSGGGELFETKTELLDAMRRIQTDHQYRARLSRQGHEGFHRHWVETAVVPRYLDVVRRTAERRGRRDIVEALAGTEFA